MKKVCSFCIVFCCILLLVACKSSAAENVEGQINSIGEVTENSFPSIMAAMDAYDKLSERDKAAVSNYDVLVSAADTFDQLLAEVAVAN